MRNRNRMERYKAKAPSQNRNTKPTRNAAATSSPPINAAEIYNRTILRPQKRHVDDDVASSYGVWGPYRHYTYQTQVPNRSSPKITQKRPVIKDQNYYSTKFAPTNSDWSPLDDGIEINPTFTASREIFNVDFDLNGPSQRKRLPVFSNICPE